MGKVSEEPMGGAAKEYGEAGLVLISVRVPPKLRYRVKLRCLRANRSLRDFITEAITEALTEAKGGKE